MDNKQAVIRDLTQKIERDNIELKKDQDALKLVEAEDKKFQEEIALKKKQIEDLNLQIRTAETKMNTTNKALHNKLKAEIQHTTLEHNKLLADLTHVQQDLTKTMQQSGIKLK